jgi:hypothetical protein
MNYLEFGLEIWQSGADSPGSEINRSVRTDLESVPIFRKKLSVRESSSSGRREPETVY